MRFYFLISYRINKVPKEVPEVPQSTDLKTDLGILKITDT